jgi:hypothetical protein
LKDLVLQDTSILFRYFGIGQDPKTGVDAIYGLLTGGDTGNMLLTGPDLLFGRGGDAAAKRARRQVDGCCDRKPITAILEIGSVHKKIF